MYFITDICAWPFRAGKEKTWSKKTKHGATAYGKFDISVPVPIPGVGDYTTNGTTKLISIQF